MKVTADTITDEQIRELRAVASGTTAVMLDSTTVEWCDIALGWISTPPCLNTHPAHDCIAAQRLAGRARCAEIWNARASRSECSHEWSVDEQGTRRCIGCGEAS